MPGIQDYLIIAEQINHLLQQLLTRFEKSKAAEIRSAYADELARLETLTTQSLPDEIPQPEIWRKPGLAANDFPDLQTWQSFFEKSSTQYVVFKGFDFSTLKTFLLDNKSQTPLEKLKLYYADFRKQLGQAQPEGIQLYQPANEPTLPVILEPKTAGYPLLPLQLAHAPSFSLPQTAIQAQALGLGKINYYYRIDSQKNFIIEISFTMSNQEFPLFEFQKTISHYPHEIHGQNLAPLLIWLGGIFAVNASEISIAITTSNASAKNARWNMSLYQTAFKSNKKLLLPSVVDAFANDFWHENTLDRDLVGEALRQASIAEISAQVKAYLTQTQNEFTVAARQEIANLMLQLKVAREQLCQSLASHQNQSDEVMLGQALQQAVLMCDNTLVELLLNNNAPLTIRTATGDSLLHLLTAPPSAMVMMREVMRGQSPTTPAMMANRLMHFGLGDNVNCTGLSAFQQAQLQQDVGLVKALAQRGVINDIIWPEGTALHYAILHHQNSSILEAIIAAGANVNLSNSKSISPLQLAVIENNIPAAKILLRAPTKLQIPQALDSAIQCANPEMVFLLVHENPAFNDINILNNFFAKALHAIDNCLQKNNIDSLELENLLSIAKHLADQGADINSAVTADGYTLLHRLLLAKPINQEIIIELVKFYNPSAEIKSNAGETLLQAAIKTDNLLVISVIARLNPIEAENLFTRSLAKNLQLAITLYRAGVAVGSTATQQLVKRKANIGELLRDNARFSRELVEIEAEISQKRELFKRDRIFEQTVIEQTETITHLTQENRHLVDMVTQMGAKVSQLGNQLIGVQKQLEEERRARLELSSTPATESRAPLSLLFQPKQEDLATRLNLAEQAIAALQAEVTQLKTPKPSL